MELGLKDPSERCDCPDWKKWAAGINAMSQAMAILSVYSVDVSMRQWEYCPWCGRKLEG